MLRVFLLPRESLFFHHPRHGSIGRYGTFLTRTRQPKEPGPAASTSERPSTDIFPRRRHLVAFAVARPPQQARIKGRRIQASSAGHKKAVIRALHNPPALRPEKRGKLVRRDILP